MFSKCKTMTFLPSTVLLVSTMAMSLDGISLLGGVVMKLHNPHIHLSLGENLDSQFKASDVNTFRRFSPWRRRLLWVYVTSMTDGFM